MSMYGCVYKSGGKNPEGNVRNNFEWQWMIQSEDDRDWLLNETELPRISDLKETHRSVFGCSVRLARPLQNRVCVGLSRQVWVHVWHIHRSVCLLNSCESRQTTPGSASGEWWSLGWYVPCFSMVKRASAHSFVELLNLRGIHSTGEWVNSCMHVCLLALQCGYHT